MPEPPPWMETVDRRILEILAFAGGDDGAYPLSLDVVTTETGIDRQTAEARCDALDRRGLLEAVGPDAYQICPEGREYVDSQRAPAEPAPVDIGPGERPSWMERDDLRILAAVQRRDDPVAPADIAEELDVLSSYVKRRARRLAAEGLLQPIDGEAAYTTRDLGEAYLAGEVAVEKLEAPTDGATGP